MSKKVDPAATTSNAHDLRSALERHVRIKAPDLGDADRDSIVDSAEEATWKKTPATPLSFAKTVADRRIIDARRRLARGAKLAAPSKTVDGEPGDPRDALLDECRRRFEKEAGVPWTDEIATRVREAVEPKPSIEPQARTLFNDLRDVMQRADRFLAAHGRELGAELDALGTGATVPEPRTWGPATDFLRSFFVRLGPLPNVLVTKGDPWPPLSTEVRDRLEDLLSHRILPWDRGKATGPMTPRGMIAVEVLVNLHHWPALLRPKGLRTLENELRGRLKTRVGRKMTVILADPRTRRWMRVQVPGPAYIAQIAAKLAEANNFDITASDLEKILAVFSPAEIERLGKKLAATPDEQWTSLAEIARRRVQTRIDSASVQRPLPPNDKGVCKTQHPVTKRRERTSADRKRSRARDAAK